MFNCGGGNVVFLSDHYTSGYLLFLFKSFTRLTFFKLNPLGFYPGWIISALRAGICLEIRRLQLEMSLLADSFPCHVTRGSCHVTLNIHSGTWHIFQGYT